MSCGFPGLIQRVNSFPYAIERQQSETSTDEERVARDSATHGYGYGVEEEHQIHLNRHACRGMTGPWHGLAIKTGEL